MIFIKLTNDALVTSPALVRVEKIKYVIETSGGSTIWLDNDETLDVCESVDTIFLNIYQTMADMAHMGIL